MWKLARYVVKGLTVLTKPQEHSNISRNNNNGTEILYRTVPSDRQTDGEKLGKYINKDIEKLSLHCIYNKCYVHNKTMSIL